VVPDNAASRLEYLESVAEISRASRDAPYARVNLLYSVKRSRERESEWLKMLRERYLIRSHGRVRGRACIRNRDR